MTEPTTEPMTEPTTWSARGGHALRVAAVFSAFRPDAELVEHCASVAPQVSQVIVVDDGSGDSAEPVLQRLEQAGVLVVRHDENLGIGAAMNTGIAAAEKAGAEFVLTFDQDSQVPSGFVEALVNEFDRASAAGLEVGMVCPEFFSATPQTRTGPEADPGLQAKAIEAYAPIQSGLLMPTAAIRAIGPQRADYFIDLIDTEYYLRARRAGYAAVCAPGLVLPHGFGHRLYVHALGRRLLRDDGRPRVVSVSSPFRYYYRARNRVVLNREYGRDPGVEALLARDARHDLLPDFAVALYSARGALRLLSLLLAGWRDGRRGRLGRMPGRLARRAAGISWRHPVKESP